MCHPPTRYSEIRIKGFWVIFQARYLLERKYFSLNNAVLMVAQSANIRNITLRMAEQVLQSVLQPIYDLWLQHTTKF
jgi:hypothetical protein